MKKIKTALIGCGYWGSILKKYIQESYNFELECVCNSKSNLNKEVWNNKDIQAVVVATPNKTHYQIVKNALLAGKHVLSEKPLALKVKECQELKKIAQQKNLKLVTEYVFNFSKALAKAKDAIESGVVGKIKSVEIAIKHLGRFKGGSVYWLLGSHALSILDMFVPLKNLEFSKKDLLVYKGNIETGMILFEKHGLSGVIYVSLNYLNKETKIMIDGDNGTIIYDPRAEISLQIGSYKRMQWTVADKLPKNIKTYKIDESNNLKYTFEYFYKVLAGSAGDNIDMAIEITRVLENIQK